MHAATVTSNSELLYSVLSLCYSLLLISFVLAGPRGLHPAILLDKAMSSWRCAPAPSSHTPSAVSGSSIIHGFQISAKHTDLGCTHLLSPSARLSLSSGCFVFDLHQICLFVLQTESYCQGAPGGLRATTVTEISLTSLEQSAGHLQVEMSQPTIRQQLRAKNKDSQVCVDWGEASWEQG
jgi:hypothetical protein